MVNPKLKSVFAAGIVGGDWTFHLTKLQLDRLFSESLSSWTELGSLLGERQSFLTSFPVQLFLKIISELGVSSYSQILVVVFLIFGFLFMYMFLRFLKINRFFSVFGSLMYLLTPVVFNYLLMGWIFVLFAYALFPLISLLFIKSVQKRDFSYAILAGLLYALALMQSQSLVWIPMLLLCYSFYLITDKNSFIAYIKSFSIIIILLLLLHSHWWPGLMLVQDPGIAGSEMVLSSVSIGTSARLNFENLIRLWGSLYNYQFETAYPRSLSILSFLPPMFMILSLLSGKNRRLTWSLTILALIPMILFLIPREIISYIPYSNLIRDTARFTILSTFAYTVLTALFLNWANQQAFSQKHRSFIASITLIFLAFYSKPFWDESFFGSGKAGYDFRYRNYNFPKSYETVENILHEEKDITRALFLPLGGTYGLIDDERFNGAYQGIRDTFAGYSPIPGVIWYSDRRAPVGGDLIASLEEAIIYGNINLVRKLAHLMGSKYLVFRQHTWPEAQTLRNLEENFKNAGLENIFNSPEISLYKFNAYLPYIYIPNQVVAIGSNPGNLASAIKYRDFEDSNTDSTVIVNQTETDLSNQILIKPKRVQTLLKDPISWNPGWLWPTDSRISPSNPKYLLMRIKEFLIEKNNSEPIKKADIIIWHASKRIVEEKKWKDTKTIFFETGSKEFIKKLEETYLLLQNLPIKTDDGMKFKGDINVDDYLGIIMKVLAFSEKAAENTTSASTKEEITTLNNQFRTWIDRSFYGWCSKENYCYEMDIPKQGSYTLTAETASLNTKPEGIQINLLEGKINNGSLSKPHNSDYVNLAKIDYEKSVGNRIILKAEPSPNLVDDTQIKVEAKKLAETEVEESENESNMQSTNIYYQESLKRITVTDLEPGKKYKVSFEFKTSNGPLRVTLFEDQFDFEKSLLWGADYAESKDNEVLTKTVKILDKTMLNSYTNLKEYKEMEGWEKSEIFFTANQGTRGAELFFQPYPSEETISKSEIRKLEIRKISSPELLLVKTQEQDETIKPLVSFKKINSTKYLVDLEGVQNPFMLVFNEGYHNGWQLYPKESSFLKSILAEPFPTKHYLVNGFANAYYIDPSYLNSSQSNQIVIEFWPQRLVYLGLVVAGTTLTLCLIYLARKKIRIK